MQERLFDLSLDKQVLEKHLSCAVKYLVGQVGHGISTGLIQVKIIEHSAILSTCIRLPPLFKTFILSIFVQLLKTVLTVPL